MQDDLIVSTYTINLNDIWERALEKIAMKVTVVSFEVWIKVLHPLELKGNTLVLATNSSSCKNVLSQRDYKKIITACLNEVNSSITNVEFVVEDEAASEEQGAPKAAEESDELVSSAFSPKYTFDNFVVGASNQFVAAAAKAVAENPGKKKNPLFIYGGVGLGKTHLLHAIGNYITETRPKLNVVYVTCAKFTNDLIESIRDSKKTAASDFRAKYRKADVLIVDDIEFIANKVATQTEFFNLFNELYDAGKQIVLSSDRPPKEINPLEERLRSRFEWGLLADIGVPDLETKIAIILKKAQIEHYNVTREVIEYIASAQITNIRTLEGMLSRVAFYAELIGESVVTIDTAREALKGMAVHSEVDLDAGVIIDNVCKAYNIKKEDLLAKKRTKEIALARQVAMYLISDLLGMPQTSIGEIFGKDHATVIYAKTKVAEDMQKDKKFATEVNDIKQMIKGK